MIRLQAGYKGEHKRLHGGGRAARGMVSVFAATSCGSWGQGRRTGKSAGKPSANMVPLTPLTKVFQ